jgi:hypothetical protein
LETATAWQGTSIQTRSSKIIAQEYATKTRKKRERTQQAEIQARRKMTAGRITIDRASHHQSGRFRVPSPREPGG